MTTLKDKIIEAGFADRILTNSVLISLLDATDAARYGMVNKALKKGDLIKVRRGLCLLADKYRNKKLSQFFLASRVVSHSYVSLESALSYHGFIPERVTTVTSVLYLGRNKKFITPFGEFVFYRLPVNEYEFLTCVTRVVDNKNQPFLLASPLRALADYVYLKHIDWENISYLTNNLRIDIEQLMQIDLNDFVKIKKVYRSLRVLHFLNSLEKELKTKWL